MRHVIACSQTGMIISGGKSHPNRPDGGMNGSFTSSFCNGSQTETKYRLKKKRGGGGGQR